MNYAYLCEFSRQYESCSENSSYVVRSYVLEQLEITTDFQHILFKVGNQVEAVVIEVI